MVNNYVLIKTGEAEKTSMKKKNEIIMNEFIVNGIVGPSRVLSRVWYAYIGMQNCHLLSIVLLALGPE